MSSGWRVCILTMFFPLFCLTPGTYRYTVSNSVGSIQGKVTLYVTSETSGWSRQPQGPRRMGLPTVTSALVTVEQFPQFVREKNENGSKGLRDQFLCLSSCEEAHSTSVALSDENKMYNRFTNIIPYDDNRVKLKSLSGREDCQHDYINASYIDGYGIARKFVATQGPTDTTVVDFWRMVWQLHSPTVVMMTNLEEGRKKCEQYWPNFGTTDYGPYSVTLAEQKIRADYNIRKLTLTSTFSTRRVHYVNHYQFTSWRDHHVPDSAFPLLEFHRRLTENHRPNKGPIIIHCRYTRDPAHS
jgi:protein tyrosine phosphatase